jgi:hypothetical protein
VGGHAILPTACDVLTENVPQSAGYNAKINQHKYVQVSQNETYFFQFEISLPTTYMSV